MKQQIPKTKWQSALYAFVLAACLLSANAWAESSKIGRDTDEREGKGANARTESWKFGVISDTQWTKADDGKNPNTCAADIIKQVNKQFINQGVKLVIAVGDTVDVGSAVSIGTRALYSQDLYNAGIGFYPLRGNHEAAENPPDLTSGPELRHAFPQIGTGVNNNTPGDITIVLIPSADLANNPPATKTGVAFTLGDNFSEPTSVNTANHSVSYSFDYKNVRFVLLDQFDVNGAYLNSTIPQQQPWINAQLSDPSRPQQAFVFAHKNLLGGNHKDNLFGGPANGSDPGDAYNAVDNSKQVNLDAFITSLADNGVRYFVSGHDHHQYESIVNAPITDGKSVTQLILQSDSSKFYTPVTPFSSNDVPVSQDLYRVGYYIFTVDGPRVTVDYYGSDATFPSAFSTTPTLNFVLRDSFGYSLNGKQFLVGRCDSYTGVHDSIPDSKKFLGTSMQILAGDNLCPATSAIADEGTPTANSVIPTTNDGRQLTKTVNTGWSPATKDLASDILTLWGMAELGTEQTEVFVLQMAFDKEAPRQQFGNGGFGIATRGADGKWVNAVRKNFGGDVEFVKGPWNSDYPLGTYGVDPKTKTAWAVINYNGDFAVTTGIETPPHHRK